MPTVLDEFQLSHPERWHATRAVKRVCTRSGRTCSGVLGQMVSDATHLLHGKRVIPALRVQKDRIYERSNLIRQGGSSGRTEQGEPIIHAGPVSKRSGESTVSGSVGRSAAG